MVGVVGWVGLGVGVLCWWGWVGGCGGWGGHDHEISARVTSGTVDMTSHRVEFHTNARSLRVVDQGISDKDRGEIQSNMLGPPVLDAEHFPEIVFQSTGANSGGTGSWTVSGNLTLHGQTRALTLTVREAAGHFYGDIEAEAVRFRHNAD